MSVLEPFGDGLILGEDRGRVAVDHVDGGHVAFALRAAQVEAQVLLVACSHALRVGLRGEV